MTASRASGDAQSPVPASGAGPGIAGPSEDDTAPCLFCDRSAHEILGESYSWYIRLDAYPAAPGHVELVTKRHVVSFFALNGAEAAELHGVLGYARELVVARFDWPDAWTIGINDGTAAGRSVDHLHVHLIPRHYGDVPDPRGGIRRGLPNCDPDAWTAEAPKRDLAWFLARTPSPDGTPPPRTAAEWNRQSVAAFITNHSPKETAVPQSEPVPAGQFWDDLQENLKNPEFRREFIAFTQEMGEPTHVEGHTEMRGEDVPQPVLDAAFGGYSMHGAGLVANLIAAVWPEIARQVRAQVAAEYRAAAEIRRETAERVLLVSDLALGSRCPACHGRPAVHRWKDTGRKKRYVCGCGHQWDAPTRSAEWRTALDASPTALLRQVAEKGDLPEIPVKIARGEAQ